MQSYEKQYPLFLQVAPQQGGWYGEILSGMFTLPLDNRPSFHRFDFPFNVFLGDGLVAPLL